MFSSRIIDKTSNCNIIKHSLLDDLLPYTVNSNGTLTYNDNTAGGLVRSTSLDTLIQQSQQASALDVWQPLIINSDTYVNNKLLSSHGSCYNGNTLLTSGQLGIESFFSFNPNFKSWTTSNAKMSIDWFLNGQNTPYSVYYGILCWFRLKDVINNPNIHGGKEQPLTYFPNGSRLVKSGDTNSVYIKINNDRLYSINQQSRTINNGNYVFDDELGRTIVEVSSLGTSPLFKMTNIYKSENVYNNTSSVNRMDMNPILWVPDGDCFFFHNSDAERVSSLLYNISCRSYVSSALYQKYSSIYRILTLDEKRSFSNKNLKRSRFYKRIAHALSTSPFVDDFSIEALDSIEIRNFIQSKVNEPFTDMNGEILNFKNLLINISRFLQNTTNDTTNKSLYLDTKFSPTTINNNLINDNSQLFYKLISKYGAHLRLSGTSTISAKTNVLKFDNKGIAITQVLDNYCSKTLTNTSVYNNQKIIFDNTTIQTKLNEFNANIDVLVDNVKKITIPLYDVGKPRFRDIPLNLKTLFIPSMAYKGDVPRFYLSDDIDYNDPANQRLDANNQIIYDYIYSTVVDDGAEVNLQLNPNQPHCSKLQESGIQLSALTIEEIEKSYDEGSELSLRNYINSQNSFFWEQLEGPQGTFGKTQLLSGTSNEVVFYTNYTGKYVLQCTISSPFGTFKKQKTIYVVDGRQLVRSGLSMAENTISYGKYWDSKNISWVYPPLVTPLYMASENIPLILDKDVVKTNVSKINKIAISNYHGVIYPIKTDFSVREVMGTLGTRVQDDIYSLSKDYIFGYNSSDYTYRETCPLTLIYETNNTIVKLHSVWLEKIRTDQDDCSQCLSLYFPKIRSLKISRRISQTDSNGNVINTRNINFNRTIRTNKDPEGFTLRAYEWDTARNLAKCIRDSGIFSFPVISTKKAPKIKAYGGYSKKFIDSIGVEINGLTKPQISVNDRGIVAGSGASTNLPVVTGFPLNYRNFPDTSTYKLCYQKAVMVSGTGLIMPFTKGVFHPNSGWIPYSGGNEYSIHANRGSVLKFNPGARDSFSFLGPQITRLRSGPINIENNTIQSKTFSSSITLGIGKEIQWDPACSCEPKPGEDIKLYNDNQKHKNYIDTKITNVNNFSNHGYRILGGGEPKGIEATATNNSPIANDEFLTDQSQTNFSYSFAVTGPHSLPEKIQLPDGRMQFRIPRVNGFGIKDIEVKLNFLNYVNTKNMVVWLDVDYCDGEAAPRFSSKANPPPSPLRSSEEFLDQTFDPRIFFGNYSTNQNRITGSLNNTKMENYLKDLVGINSPSGASGSSFKLVLLNQETIQNNQYNFSIKFSDHASKFNAPCDMNLLGSGYYHPSGQYPYMTSQIAKLQNIIRSNDELLPTVAATGYSDRECCEYSSIIKHNKLNISNNTFSKFVANVLFKNRAPERGPCQPESTPKQRDGDFDGRTTFTLNIMVLDEEDDMNVLDSTINNQYLSGLESTETNTKSNLLYNSLCNWELILHVGSTRDPVPNTNPSLASYGNNDALSLFDYKKDPSYPSYSFIADLKDQKHLLPIANYNAPYSCISDSTTCLTSQDDPTGQGVMVRPPEFPYYAIIQILASLAGYGATTGGTLVGALAGLEGAINNPGYNAIFDYFKEVRFSENLENQGRQIYFPSYAKYPFGSPEKILINFKKPDSLWYTAEASIFKYHNTPILKPDRYKFIKLSGGVDGLGDFSFDLVNSIEDLIDQNFIKQINLSCESNLPNLPLPTAVSGSFINEGDIVRVSFTGNECENPSQICVANNNEIWTNLKLNPSALSKANHYLQHNAILGSSNSLSSTDLSGNKAVLVKGRIPYDIFKKGDVVNCSGISSTNARISKKGLIYKNNKYYSLLVFENSVSGYNLMSIPNTMNIFLTYKDETTIIDKTSKKYNIWGADYINKNVFNNTTDITPTTHSIGSYGDLSLFINKNILSNNIHNNQLQEINDIFNNRKNDKIKHNKIKIFVSGIENTGFVSNSSYGFSYSKEDLNVLTPIFRKEKENKDYYYIESNTDDSTNRDTIVKNIEFSSSYNDIPSNFSIIRTDDGLNALTSGISTGELEIENKYYEYKPMRSITSNELTWITSRLSIIESTGVDNTLEAAVGIPGSTSTILNSYKLKYLEKHYAKLEDDPIDCYTPRPTNAGSCHKKKTYAAIKDLLEERNSILQLLDEQTIFDVPANNNTYELNRSDYTKYKLKSSLPITDPRRLSPHILPKIEPVLSGIRWRGANDGEKSGPIYIHYREANKDHYWINIDSKQSCFQDFESNPKVLISTKYKCTEANPVMGVTSPYIDNNICPFFTTRPDQAIRFSFGAPENITSNVDEFTYTINSNTVDQQKNEFQRQYPAITGWKTLTKLRYFNINGDQTMDIVLGPGAEITIESTELYAVPLTNENQGNDNSGDTLDLPGIAGCQTNIGSPAGKGMMTLGNTRIGKPTRVCNIVNLDTANNISVMVKRIPRMLRGVDILSTVYRYGSKSEFRPASFTSPPVPFETDLVNSQVGNINNSLYVWVALQRNSSTLTLETTTLPDFFKLQNEMIFRSFFGSVDRIENKSDVAASYFPWEMIPYEYE